MEKINILIIDDEKDLCDLVKEIIEDSFPSIRCTTLNHWGAFDEKTPNLGFIIADQNGVGKQPSGLKTRVLTFSGDLDINPDIPKPFDIHHLIKAIEDACDDISKAHKTKIDIARPEPLDIAQLISSCYCHQID